MSSLDLDTFVAGYLVEADEHLRATTRNLLEAEKRLSQGASTARQVRELFRSMHTIKGLSAMVGVDPVVELAHEMETVLRAADRAGGMLEGPAIELLVRGVHAIEVRVRSLRDGQPVEAAPSPLIDALAALSQIAETGPRPRVGLELPDALRGKLTAAEEAELASGLAQGRRAVRLDFMPSPGHAAAGLTITTVRERASKVGELVKVAPLSVPRSAEAPGGLAFALIMLTEHSDDEVVAAVGVPPGQMTELGRAARAPTGAAEQLEPEPEPEVELDRGEVVRVPVTRLDDALEKLSLMVVTRFRLSRAVSDLAARGVDVVELSHIVQDGTRQLRDLRASIMRARMVSVAELLERVPLIVRGLSRSTGKEVALTLDAGRAELDKAVGERLFPAVVHLIRNAVDHAIEPPMERERLGKPRAGQIRVECHERGQSQLELRISDDGRGIDRTELARRAGAPVPMDESQLLDLLTRPGLSTRDQATTTSGRGLGMDIVKRVAVDQLGGELGLDSVPGQGTTFTVRVPLSITIVDAFSFACGGQVFVVPVSMIDEIVELDTARVVRPPDAGAGSLGLLDRRGESVPVVDLDVCFALPRADQPGRKAIVVRRNGRPFAFAVDRMLGHQEVVVRPVDDPLVRVTGVSGSTDLGDGRPTLVLDFLALGGTLARSRGASA